MVDLEAAPRSTLDDVKAHSVELQQIGQRYGVHNIRVFGSVARGEAGPRATSTSWWTSCPDSACWR